MDKDFFGFVGFLALLGFFFPPMFGVAIGVLLIALVLWALGSLVQGAASVVHQVEDGRPRKPLVPDYIPGEWNKNREPYSWEKNRWRRWLP